MANPDPPIAIECSLPDRVMDSQSVQTRWQKFLGISRWFPPDREGKGCMGRMFSDTCARGSRGL